MTLNDELTLYPLECGCYNIFHTFESNLYLGIIASDFLYLEDFSVWRKIRKRKLAD